MSTMPRSVVNVRLQAHPGNTSVFLLVHQEQAGSAFPNSSWTICGIPFGGMGSSWGGRNTTEPVTCLWCVAKGPQ